STFNSLTLSPALAALLLKPRRKGVYQTLPWPAFLILGCWAGYTRLGPYLLRHASATEMLAGTSALSAVVDLGRMAGFEPELATGMAGAVIGGLVALALSRPINRILGFGFELFNRGFQATANGYARLVGGLLRVFVLVLLVYGGVLA